MRYRNSLPRPQSRLVIDDEPSSTNTKSIGRYRQVVQTLQQVARSAPAEALEPSAASVLRNKTRGRDAERLR